ncbi:polysaccharide deacetylase family protein [Pseudoalteromonas viridis]|uniref:Polysaccharide deacetylase family protein n=1 Tax=Pseudoalteromonas viridis TaxID=339617 RepID=A0ABX7VDL8_9GAMM|nr:polysaccharide deacetylase family protein [Pseudoalteromonas viridis]QTL37932.1 polysaccharide deacetylase family protein [Pseudoalteromonas viridis]
MNNLIKVSILSMLLGACSEHHGVDNSSKAQNIVVSADSNVAGTATSEQVPVDNGSSQTFGGKPSGEDKARDNSGCNGTLLNGVYTEENTTSACEPGQYTVDIDINDSTFGSAKIERSNFTHGEIAKILISPIEGFEIANVSGCGGTLNKNTYETASLEGSCSVEVQFKATGRLMLSFDDAYLESWWEKAHPVLDSYDMKAIFYINADYVNRPKLKEYTDLLFENGHIIGHHSCSHQFVGTYEGDYMADEIERCIDFYKDYNLKHFAYPYGWAGWNAEVEEKLKARFETVRLFNTVWNEDGSTSSRPQLSSSIDGVIINGNWEPVWALLDKAREDGRIVHLSSHGINDSCEASNQGWRICLRDLQLVIDYAHSIGLELGPPKSWF